MAVDQHPGSQHTSDVLDIPAAVGAAAEKDGTLLVLDHDGRVLQRLSVLHEILVTLATGGAEKLHLQSRGLKRQVGPCYSQPCYSQPRYSWPCYSWPRCSWPCYSRPRYSQL